MAKTPFARRARRRVVGIVLVLTTLRLAGACGDRAGDSDTSVDAVAEVGSDAGRSDTREDAGVDSTDLAEDAAPDVRDVQSDLDVGDVEDGESTCPRSATTRPMWATTRPRSATN
ncbi:MAG: hypothetical protein H6699_09390 [Myxococcales bacterium]|nr:hypothetical protein [Myxococcales bacterium]